MANNLETSKGLQIWLPLTKDLHNLGLALVSITNNGATYSSTEGKLGGCYSFNGPSYIQLAIGKNINCANGMTFAYWIKYTDTSINLMVFRATNDSDSNQRFYTGLYNGKLCLAYGSTGWSYPGNVAASANIWYHVAIIANGTTATLYINGEDKGSITSSNAPTLSANPTIGNTVYYPKGSVNDVRLYSYALSPQEVKEISKGLVVHYALSRNGAVGHNEVIWNGNDGTVDGRTVYRNGRVSEKIYLRNKDTYRISGDIKTENSSSTAYSYPSIMPYDVDGLFIKNEHTPDGFLSETCTTLTLQLKSGDTVIYCQNLSAWSTTSTYAYIAAIFGYQDSTGYTYPDMTYTRTIVVFGTTTDKSHINKTNNTITLNSAYSGRTVPAGTTIVLSLYGSTNYYPWGGILQSSVVSWTSKTVDLIPSNVNRLKWAKYITFSCLSGLYYSNIDIHNITNRIVYDSSGYNNNGTITGILKTADTPRYDKCILGTSSTISAPYNIQDGPVTLTFWQKPTIYTTEDTSKIDIRFGNCHYFTYINYTYFIHNPDYKFRYINPFLDGNWHFIVGLFDGTNTKIFIDGNEITCQSTSDSRPFVNSLTITLTDESISDFRIYATALSADDIKDLYNLRASIS